MSIRNVMKPDHFLTYCKRCGTRFEFEENDIHQDGNWMNGEIIECPNCGFAKTIRGIDQELVPDIEIVWSDTLEAYT